MHFLACPVFRSTLYMCFQNETCEIIDQGNEREKEEFVKIDMKEFQRIYKA